MARTYDNESLETLEAILGSGDVASIGTAVNAWDGISTALAEVVDGAGSRPGLLDVVAGITKNWSGDGAEEFKRQLQQVVTYTQDLNRRAKLATPADVLDFRYTTESARLGLDSAKNQLADLPAATTKEHNSLVSTVGSGLARGMPTIHNPFGTHTVDNTVARKGAAAQLVNMLAVRYEADAATFPDPPDAKLPTIGGTSDPTSPFSGGGLGGGGLGGAGLPGLGGASPELTSLADANVPDATALARQLPMPTTGVDGAGLDGTGLGGVGAAGAGAGLDPAALDPAALDPAALGSGGANVSPLTDLGAITGSGLGSGPLAGLDSPTSLAGFPTPTGLDSPSFGTSPLTPAAFGGGSGTGTGILPGGSAPGFGVSPLPGVGVGPLTGGGAGSGRTLPAGAFKLGKTGTGINGLGGLPGEVGGFGSTAGSGTVGRLGAASAAGTAAAEENALVAGRAGSSGFLAEPVAGAGIRGAAAGAGAGGMPMSPYPPQFGGAQGQNGRERSTWLYEQDDVWDDGADGLPPTVIA